MQCGFDWFGDWIREWESVFERERRYVRESVWGRKGGRSCERESVRACVRKNERGREKKRGRKSGLIVCSHVVLRIYISIILEASSPFFLPNFFSYASLPSSFFIYLLSFSLYHTSYFLHSFYSLLISLSFYHPLKIYLMIYFVFLIKEKSKKKWKSEKKYI